VDPTNQELLPKDILGFTPGRELPATLEHLELNDDSLVALGNPVVNPPYNNWSVNQPSPPHDSGLNKEDDIGLRDMVVDGINGYDFVQTGESQHLMPMAPKNLPGNLAIVDRDVKDNLDLL